MWFNAIFAITLFAALAMMVREGLWSNTLSMANILISGLAAFGFHGPLVAWLDEQMSGQFTYVIDYVMIWVLFVLFMVICRGLTRMASATRMRFKHPIDPVAGPIVGFLAAYALASFTTATLFMAPMPKSALGNRLELAGKELDTVHTDAYSAGRAVTAWPDLGWLRFVEKMSNIEALGARRDRTFSAKGFLASQDVHRGRLESATLPWYLKVKRGS
ncbi:MAG: CvpA family protein [Pirellulales bacterium]